MRVFHFASKEHAISNIENSRIKIAIINELNDPFEFYVNFTSSGKPIDERKVSEVKTHYNNILGFLCFSKNWNNPVQWAHYSDRYKGLCMEFEIPNKVLLKIKYRNKPAVIEANDKNWRKKFVKATQSKFKHWKYEKEHRVPVGITRLDIIRENDLHFMPFSEKLKLQAVYSGLNCELSSAEISMLHKKGIDLIPTKKCRTSYSIVKS